MCNYAWVRGERIEHATRERSLNNTWCIKVALRLHTYRRVLSSAFPLLTNPYGYFIYIHVRFLGFMNPNSITRGERVDLSLFRGFVRPLPWDPLSSHCPHASKSLAPLSLSFCRAKEAKGNGAGFNWRVEGEA